MEPRAVGLFSNPWTNAAPAAPPAARGPLSMYRYAVWFKANPRSETYMRALFAERYAGGRFFNVDEDDTWRPAAAEADVLVLLYPDATGLGLLRFEREAKRAAGHGTRLRALNGRRRDFELDAATLSGLRLRRLMERLMPLEMFAIIVFMVLTPVLLAKDWLAGRR